MQLTVLTVGSRGDIQPYLALGRGLQAAGHQIRLATHPPFEPEIRTHGLDFAPITGNPRQLLHSPEGLAWLEAGRNPLRGTRRLLELARPHLTRMLTDAVTACQDAEAIIYAPLGFAGAHIAEATGVPAVLASLVPLTPTRSFPAAGAPTWPLGGAYNYLTHLVAEQLSWQPFRRLLNQWRRQSLGLGPAPRRGLVAAGRRGQVPVLYGYSPSILPKPPDWGAHLHVTGYWFGDPQPAWQPPAALAGFLADGPPPVYIGFGSMTDRNPAELARIVLGALRRTGRRGLLQAGWAGLTDAAGADDVLVVDDVPHDWLFARMAAVVHHGGAGTTHTGLRAGVPSVIVPFFTDQPFWAQRIAALGVGPRPIPRSQLTVERLARAIHAATSSPALQARAAAVGQQLRGEHGVELAVAAFGALVGAQEKQPA